MLHRFHLCPKTKHAWDFALTILYSALKVPQNNGTWLGLTWQQCVMGSKLPRRLKKGSCMWSLFRGSVLWISWLDRNALCFNDISWPPQQLEYMLWEAFTDHARAAWLKTTNLCALYPEKEGNFLKRFDHVWLQTDFFGTRSQHLMRWNFSQPQLGSFA